MDNILGRLVVLEVVLQCLAHAILYPTCKLTYRPGRNVQPGRLAARLTEKLVRRTVIRKYGYGELTLREQPSDNKTLAPAAKHTEHWPSI